jgi:hypothetical protein
MAHKELEKNFANHRHVFLLILANVTFTITWKVRFLLTSDLLHYANTTAWIEGHRKPPTMKWTHAVLGQLINCSQIGQFFAYRAIYFGQFFIITEVYQIFGLLFSMFLCNDFDKKMDWAAFWAIFWATFWAIF